MVVNLEDHWAFILYTSSGLRIAKHLFSLCDSNIISITNLVFISSVGIRGLTITPHSSMESLIGIVLNPTQVGKCLILCHWPEPSWFNYFVLTVPKEL